MIQKKGNELEKTTTTTKLTIIKNINPFVNIKQVNQT